MTDFEHGAYRINVTDLEFYPTPAPLTNWLIRELQVRELLHPDQGVHDPCVGAADIVSVFRSRGEYETTGADLNPRWSKPPQDAITSEHKADWQVTNPPFTQALPILQQMFLNANHGVALYHRVTLREPLKGKGLGRTLCRANPPTLTLWCPRFAHMRSRTKGIWSTDSVACVWSVWAQGEEPHGDVSAPDYVFDALADYTPAYRSRVDHMMGLTGPEVDRRRQFIDLCSTRPEAA